MPNSGFPRHLVLKLFTDSTAHESSDVALIPLPYVFDAYIGRTQSVRPRTLLGSELCDQCRNTLRVETFADVGGAMSEPPAPTVVAVATESVAGGAGGGGGAGGAGRGLHGNSARSYSVDGISSLADLA